MKQFNNNHSNIKQQQGSALMLALFIIVVLMLLGSALVEVLSTGSETVAQEVLGTRALSAANAGADAQLQVVFPISGSEVCEANQPSNNYSFVNVDGLNHCSAVANCEQYATNTKAGVETKFYRITSTGTCGSSALASDSLDVVVSRRTIQIEARSL